MAPIGDVVAGVELPDGRGTVSRAVRDAVTRVEHVADQQCRAVVEAVDVGAVVRVSEVEPFGHLLLGIVGVTVHLHLVGEQVTNVTEQLQVVLDRRVAPDLRRVGHVGVAGRDQRRGVGPLHAAVRRVGVAVLQAEIDETGVAQRQSDVAGHGVRIAVAGAVRAGVELQAPAGPIVLGQEVHHAGDGVRAVLRRGAVTQHLDLPQRNRRDGGDVRSLCTVRHAGEPSDDRRAVAALAVHQHQRVVVRQVAQTGRPNQRGRVTDRVRGDVERGDQRPQLVVERGGALADDVLQRDGVNRYRRGGHRPRLGAVPHDDDPFLDLHRHLHIEGGRGTRSDLHTRAYDLPEPGQRKRHVVRAGLKRGERERAGVVGRGGPERTGGRRGSHLHGDTRQHKTRRVGHRAGQYDVLRDGPLLYQFGLGGPFRLSSFDPDRFRGQRFLHVTGGYLRSVAQLPDFLGGPIYAMGFFETGSAYDPYDAADWHGSGSAGVVMDTILGPLLVAGAFGDESSAKFYFTLGDLFR